MIRYIIFDLGGVVFESPFKIINSYARKNNVDILKLHRVFGSKNGGFKKLEEGKIRVDEFCELFEKELLEVGINNFPIRTVMKEIHLIKPIEMVLKEIESLRRKGYKIACITNNWEIGDDHNLLVTDSLGKMFDVVVESCKVKIRKPNERIYKICLNELKQLVGEEVRANECVFLDDIGRNLKPARKMGMKTILVRDQKEAIKELRSILNSAKL